MDSRNGDRIPETHFAPAARVSRADLERQVAAAGRNAAIGALLETVQGLVAVLNEQRQIVAVNTAYLAFLGIEDPDTVLGLRPGESVACVHADDHPGGCGTGRFCSSCGAAVAIVTSLVETEPVMRECALVARRGGEDVHLDLRVTARGFRTGEWTLILLFLDDITEQKRRASLERAFFHDMSNVVAAMSGLAEVIVRVDDERRPEIAGHLLYLAGKLRSEVELQSVLAHSEAGDLHVTRVPVSLAELLGEAEQLFTLHPAAEGRTLAVACACPEASVETDRSLAIRILGNMLVNAFEATAEGGEVRLEATRSGDGFSFSVWNAGTIPAGVACRVFQRYFTTKAGLARGQGTYIMKLLAERYLGGRMGFQSSGEGTTFTLLLPG